MVRDQRDIEMEELRNQVQQLQQRLELYEALERNQPHRASEVKMKNQQMERMKLILSIVLEAVHRVMKLVPIVMLVETMISSEIMTLR